VSCDLQLGKPEYVAGYISAVSSSTGSSAYYWLAPDALTAVQAWVTPGDLGVAISNSDEIKATLSALRYKRMQHGQKLHAGRSSQQRIRNILDASHVSLTVLRGERQST